MFADVDLSISLSKAAFHHIRLFQRQRLYELKKKAAAAKLPVIIIFEGWDAAGKGTTIQALTHRLDPRGLKVYPIVAPRTYETKMHWLWRYWMKIPAYGQMAIYDQSWYRQILESLVAAPTAESNGSSPTSDRSEAIEEIIDFERLLVDDGMVFIKFWLHISQEEQLRRLIQLTQNPHTTLQVTAAAWQRCQQYKTYLQAAETLLSQTHTKHAPWSVVAATDRHLCIYTVFKTMINAIEKALQIEPTYWLNLESLEAEVQALMEHSQDFVE